MALFLCVGGCARQVVRHPVDPEFVEQQQQKKYVAVRPTAIRLDSGYERTIRAGTEFADAGRIKQGRILKPIGSVFTVEGAHTHEAYPVVDNERIVGFFLPVERAFSPLSQSVTLSIEERKP